MKGLISISTLEFTWIIATTVSAMSIEKLLLTSVTKPEALDFFHAMPDGEIKVLQELDMVLSLDQYKQLYMEDVPGRDRHKRKAFVYASKWPNRTVFYEIHNSSILTESHRSSIRGAISDWQKYTCLNFVESLESLTRIQFKHGNHCSSEIGMQGRIQEVTLTSGCLSSKGTIVHEIGHSIGWFHEHMRPDRNDYITVNYDRIDEFFKMDYDVYRNGIDTYGVQYDYTSIMHYGNDVFPGSIVTKDPRYQDKLGQRVGLSFKDIKLANTMYDCSNGCDKRLDCGDGFQLNRRFKNRDACENCWCDSGDLFDPLRPCRGREVTKPPSPKTTPPQPTPKPDKDCKDKHPRCGILKKKGLCMTKMLLMESLCKNTCGFCGAHRLSDMIPCMDHDPGCAVMAMSGFHKDLGMRSRMSSTCKASSGLCKQMDPCKIRSMVKDMANDKNEAVVLRNAVTVVILLSLTVTTSVYD